MLSAAVRASLEPTVNVALRADPKAQERLRAVLGKVIRITIKELPESMTIGFHSQAISLLGPEYDAIDASVELSLFDLAELSDAAAVTHAIQQGRVKVVGDPILLQRASTVFTALEIDWEALLADWFGDVPGYILSQQLARAFNVARSKGQQMGRGGVQPRLQEILVDELEWLASSVHLKVLNEQVEVELERVDALWQRLQTYKESK